jgi:hypothetical protein
MNSSGTMAYEKTDMTLCPVTVHVILGIPPLN